MNNNYMVCFNLKNEVLKFPVNPEEIEVSSSLATQTLEVLKLGQIIVPTHMELKKYSFESEFPATKTPALSGVRVGAATARGGKTKVNNGLPYYADQTANFKEPGYYISKFEEWMKKKVPIWFMATNGDPNNDIVVEVLITEITITERAGEEGDKYIKFGLTEYRKYGKKVDSPLEVDKVTGKKTQKKTAKTNPKSTGYHVVASAETLWSIAKKYYGDGSKCNIIFNANKDKIKNPNMISIGQKFKIPTADEFSKYSADLPVTKTTTATKAKTTTLATQKAIVGERSVAGISMLLDSISGSGGVGRWS